MFVAAQALGGGTSQAKSLLDAHSHELVVETADELEELDLESRLSDQQLDRFRRQLSRMKAAYDGLAEGDVTYVVTFHAGEAHRKHQALNLSLHFRLFGTKGYTEEIISRPATSSTVADMVEVHLEHQADVGHLLAVAVGHHGDGSQKTLFLNRLTVRNEERGEAADVPIFSWFSRERGDHTLFRVCWAFGMEEVDVVRPPIRLTVNDVRHEEDFTLYSIVVESGVCKWRLWKRYSELHDLHEVLKKLHPSKERAALFPRKHLRKHDSSVIENRVASFKEWLRTVVHDSALMQVAEVRGTLQIRPPCLRNGSTVLGTQKKEVADAAHEEQDAEEPAVELAEEAAHAVAQEAAQEAAHDAAGEVEGGSREDSSDDAGQAMEMAPVE